MVAKLQKKGAGAPAREPVVSADEQKAMIAFYHKKEAEMAQEVDGTDVLPDDLWSAGCAA